MSAAARPGLNGYLARAHAALCSAGDRDVHIVLGNEAADPDSCVCAIALAAALDARLPDAVVAPLIAVPRADFKLQLDRVHLLRRAGLAGVGEGPAWSPAHVAFAEEVELASFAAAGRLTLHLVDHNRLQHAAYAPCVRSIIDHHAEEGLYAETVAADERAVELGVGSCASLVAERLQSIAPAVLADPSVATLLLGAVLLDTVNLNPAAKPAQHPREVAIAEGLMAGAAPLLGAAPSAEGRAAFFDELLRVKTDRALLSAFATADLLRQDYKAETLAAEAVVAGGAEAVPLGCGSTVLPLPTLLSRQPHAMLAEECAAFASARGLRLLLLMTTDLDAAQRCLLVHTADTGLRERALAALQRAGFDLEPLPLEPPSGPGGGALQAFTQGNYGLSRKALLPALRALPVPPEGRL